MRLAPLWICCLVVVASGCDDAPGGTLGWDAGTTDAHLAMDVGWSSDAADLDAGGGSDDGGHFDAGPSTEAPTWGRCRVASQADDIDVELLEHCERLHRSAPSERRYGIRWIFIDERDDLVAWTDARIAVANNLFAATEISFESRAIVRIQDSVVDVLNGDTRLSLADRTADLVAHLGVADDEPAEVVAALRDRLEAAGGDPVRVARLRPNSRVTHGRFLSLMAAAHSEDIYVVIGDRPTEQQGIGGFSSPPLRRFDALARSYIALKTSHTRLTVLAHELGHYFGLKHPHAGSQEGDQTRLFASATVAENYRARETHNLWEVLEDLLGDDLDQPLPTLYPEYDAVAVDLRNFDATRFALMDTWVRRSFTMDSDFTAFASFATFVGAWRRGDDLLQRNFLFEAGNGRSVNNCSWQRDDGGFACIYPEDDRRLEADDPLLDGVILFTAGMTSNLLSYIREPGAGARARQGGLNEQQRQIIEMSASAPARLSLRNSALE